MIDSRLAEDRLDHLKEAYADDKIDRDELDELLEGVVRDGPPFHVHYVLKQPETFVGTEDPIVGFYGYSLEADGQIYREV